MRRLFVFMRTVSRRLEKGAMTIACLSLAVMLGCILVQIVARYLLAAPPSWTEELARYAMIWGGLLGAGVAYSRRADPVLVEVSALPRTWLRTIARYIEVTAVFVFCGAVLVASPAVLSLHGGRLTDSLEAPSWLIVSVIPVSMTLILFHAATRLVGLLSGVDGSGPQNSPGDAA